ncbi:hypothetical protein E8E12_002885 [Didymella heteroderae]|uniref:Uncharacterized protein n=1 Tax=Didymella heteroderae TaxID=1769908 RepID=A0A9P5BWQ1_9PLEO|nr:hypothetical protein E8E12_002885 [Didymella heteroderae]
MAPKSSWSSSMFDGHSPSMSHFEDFVDIQRPSSSYSGTASSDFSFVEPSSSPEPAKDILARTEGRRYVKQVVRKIEKKDIRGNGAANSPAPASLENQELRFDDDELMCTGARADAEHAKLAPAKAEVPSTMTKRGPVEGLGDADGHELFAEARTQPHDTQNSEEAQATGQSIRPNERGSSFTATKNVVQTESAHSAAQLSITTPGVVFEQVSETSADTKARTKELQSNDSSTLGLGLSGSGLAPLVIFVIFSTWILCALLHSL